MNTKSKYDYGFAIILYSILFLPKIGLLDLKTIVLLVVTFFHLKNTKASFIITHTINALLLTLSSLILLLLLNSIVHNSTPYLILFRYIRSIISILCLGIYFSTKKISNQTIYNTLFLVIFFHILSIFISMVFPQVRPMIYMISGYNVKDLELRSSGLVSGYDFAGFYLNAVLVVNVGYNLKYKGKAFSVYSYLVMLATVFTSRLNTIVLIIQFIIIILYLFKNKKLSVGFSLLIIIPILAFGSIFTILSLDVFSDIKVELINKYDWIRALNKEIFYSYSGGGVEETVSSHFEIDSSINVWLGNAVKAPRDPGYVNTIYEGGVIALIMKLLCYFYLGITSFLKRKKSQNYWVVAYLVILSLVYEFKLVFCFASGVFELILVFIYVSTYESKDEYQVQA